MRSGAHVKWTLAGQDGVARLAAKAGQKVLVLERNDWFGGGVVTSAVAARGFRHDWHSATHIRPAKAMRLAPGGGIFIHRMPASYANSDPVRFFVDLTDGCSWQSRDRGDLTVVEILS